MQLFLLLVLQPAYIVLIVIASILLFCTVVGVIYYYSVRKRKLKKIDISKFLLPESSTKENIQDLQSLNGNINEIDDESLDTDGTEQLDARTNARQKLSKRRGTNAENHLQSIAPNYPYSQVNDPNKALFHVTQRKRDKRWQVSLNSSNVPIRVFDNKEEATKFAKELATKKRREQQENSDNN